MVRGLPEHFLAGWEGLGRQEDRASNKARSVSLIPPSIPPSVTPAGGGGGARLTWCTPVPPEPPGPARARGWAGGDGCSLSRGVQGSAVPPALGHGPIWARAASPPPAVPLPAPCLQPQGSRGRTRFVPPASFQTRERKERLEKLIYPRQGLGSTV